GFQPCRPGSVSRAAKLGSAAIAKGVMLSAIPLAVADLTKSRREILIVPRLYWRNSFFTRFVGIYWQQPLLPFSDEAARGLLHCRISMPPVSALGQNRRLRACSHQVCFSSMTRHLSRRLVGLISAKRRPEQVQQPTPLFDHLVGTGRQPGWHFDAECSGC